MTTLSFGNAAYDGWNPATQPQIDAGVIRMFNACLKSVNINMGWGSGSTSCSVVLVEENRGDFDEPSVGSLARVAIKNSNSGNPKFYDKFNPSYSFNFIGIVKTVDYNESTSGREITINLQDTKEILKNIPVILSRFSTDTQNIIGEINNVTYAYSNSSATEKGLKISAIQTAVESKIYTFFPKRTDTEAVSLNQIEIDMSYMFEERANSIFSEGITKFNGAITNYNKGRYPEDYDDGEAYMRSVGEKFNLYDTANRDDKDYIVLPSINIEEETEQKYICSPNHLVSGNSKDLLEIINAAMTENACDWYVQTIETNNENSFVCGRVENKVTIRIVPILRNRIDDFTKSEFEDFLSTVNYALESKNYGTELVNMDANKVFMGSKWEVLQKVNKRKPNGTNLLNQFWGFKRPSFDIEPIREIVDKYGNKLNVKGEINTNPTFVTGQMTGIKINDPTYPENMIKRMLSEFFDYDYNSLEEYTRSELVKLIEDISQFEDMYEFDLSDSFDNYLFYVLCGIYKNEDNFKYYLKMLYDYVDYYDYIKDGTSGQAGFGASGWNKSVYNTDAGYSSCIICGKEVVSDEVVDLEHGYSGDIDISFTHTLASEWYRGFYNEWMNGGDLTTGKLKNIFKLYYNGKIIDSKSISTEQADYPTIDVVFSNVLQNFKNYSNDSEKNILTYGFHEFVVETMINNPENGAELIERQYIYLKWYDEKEVNGEVVKINPYEKVRSSPLYEWAQSLGVKSLITGKNQRESDVTDLTGASSKSGQDGRKLMTYNTYYAAMNSIFEQRVSKLYNIVKGYLDEHLDRKYYAKITNNTWLVTQEVFDGVDGYQITNDYVRGKFINKENGKMPCLYRIKNPDQLKINAEDDASLYVYNNDNEGTELSLYGKADAQIFAVGKTQSEANDSRYLVCTIQQLPENITKNTARMDSVDFLSTNQGGGRASYGFAEMAMETAIMAALSEIKYSAVDVSTFNYLNPGLRTEPYAFYVPTVHEYIRYGPWVLDYRIDGDSVKNRSNYGKTDIIFDEELNPWTFKSYGEVQNYVLDQYKNSLVTEFRLNRGQVTVADVPRYNFGHQIGLFSNISSIGVNYGDGGVETTYTLSAFGVGRLTVQQREREQIINRLTNIEDFVGRAGTFVSKEALDSLLNRGM